MQSIEMYFKIPYEDKEITDDRMINHVINHIANMEANNVNHLFDSRIAATKAALLLLQTKKTSKDETKTEQYSSTITVEEYKDAFVIYVRRTAGNVSATYIKGTPEYKLFFPKPLKYYTRPLRGMIGNHIDHFILRYTEHPELGTTLLDAFTDLKDAFDPASTTQQNKIAAVKSLIAVTSVERKALNHQMYSNILYFADLHMGEPQYAKVFFNQSLLFPHHPSKAEPVVEEEFSLILQGNETKNTGLVNIVGKKARFVVIKGTNVKAYTVASLDDMEPGTEFVDLAAEADVTCDMTQLGDDNNPYLILRNLGDDEAEVVIDWVD
ncbi:MAG: hypothetical protein WCH34_07600 [Bacteroidota bacterium]